VVDYVAFGVILDDIVFPDGKTSMGVLGGGGPQAAFGMSLWTESVGLIAGVGADFPAEAEEWLKFCGIDLSGIRHSETPTPRAWQALEQDGRRTQVWRVSPQAISEQLQRSVDHIPESYCHAKGFHFGIHPLEPGLSFINNLTHLGGQVSIESFKPAERPLTSIEASQLLSAVDIFSPNLTESISMFGQAQAASLLVRMCDAGNCLIVLRLGADGALIMAEPEGGMVHIPAVPVEVVDPVGAGNAFCGGFLVGWVETGDMITAGCYGSVAASFMVEQIGLPRLKTGYRLEAVKRLENLRSQVKIYT
jgi:sugar/nucleoside kinase (ribokinase family)